MLKNFQYYKTELIAGLSMFLAVWTMTFLYAEVMLQFNFPAKHWFLCICIINISGGLLSWFFIKKPFIIAPGLGVGWFFSHLLNAETNPKTLFAAALISGLLLIILSQFKILKKTQEFLPAPLQETINIGIGFLFIRIALQQQLPHFNFDSILSFSFFLFMLPVVSLFIFKLLNKKAGYIITVFITISINYYFRPQHFNQFFLLPTGVNFIFNLTNQSILVLPLIKHILEITLFSLFDIAIGVFCLQQLLSILRIPQTPILAKTYKAAGCNNILSSIFLCGPSTAYIESSIGIQLGASSSLSILIVSFCFFIFMFCFPLATFIPPELVRGILFFIGCSLITPLYQMQYRTITANFLSIGLIGFMVIKQSILDGLMMAILSKFILDKLNKQQSLPVLNWSVGLSLIILGLRLVG
jgi:AGZA family xanthine/uracil permease-like MFS transporter